MPILKRRQVVWLAIALAALPAATAATTDEPEQPTIRLIAEVRVHGNHTTPDEEVRRIAGVVPGAQAGTGVEQAIEKRLRSSGRFKDVEVRARSRTLSGDGPLAIIIIVREGPVHDDAPPLVRPVRKAFGDTMFLPVLDYTDGYGFTYGARASFVDALGARGRLSVPVTWGGTKRIAVEADKELGRGPVSRVHAVAGIWRCENPHFEVDEDRREVRAGASRTLGSQLRASVTGGWSDVSFGGIDDEFGTLGAELTLDTRNDPAFPRNGLLARAGWTVVSPEGATIHLGRFEARGYVGLVGSTVLSVRVLHEPASAELPPYLQPLLGGSATLRGHRAGAWAGDNLFVGSVGLRIPITSPLRVARAGFTLFGDSGTAYDHGVHLKGARFHHGVGAGAFLQAAVFQVNLDVAYGIDSGARVHLMSGFRF